MSRSGVDTAEENSTRRDRTSISVHEAILGLAIILTLIAYWGAIGHHFVYDDIHQIVQNALIRSWRFAPRYFTRHLWEFTTFGTPGNYYRPLFYLWLRINYALFGLRPGGWHATSILLHLGVTLATYCLAVRILGDRVAAALAALVFGLHPVHVEAVAWVSGVPEPLMGIFLTSSFLCYLRDREDSAGAWSWRAASLSLSLAAMLTKETAVVSPALIFAYEWLFALPLGVEARDRVRRIDRAVRRAAPYSVLTLAYIGVRSVILGGLIHPSRSARPLTMLLTSPSLLWSYFKLLTWPVYLSPWYLVAEVTRPSLMNFVLPTAGLLVLGLILWVWARTPSPETHHLPKSRAIAFASIWVILPLLPLVCLTVIPTDGPVHDRYLYLPSVGFALLAALALRSVRLGQAALFGQPAIQVVLVSLVALLFVRKTMLQSLLWSDDLVLYSHAVSVMPEADIFKTDLANALAERGLSDKAARLYQEVLSRNPRDAGAAYNLGLLCYRLGNLDEAESFFRRSLAFQPNKAEALLYLGMAEFKRGRLKDAEAAVRAAIKSNPEVPGSHFARGMILKLQGNPAGAIEEFKEELALNPDQQAARDQIAEIEQRSPRSEARPPRHVTEPLA